MTDAQWPQEFDSLLRKHLPLMLSEEPLTGKSQLADLGLDSLGTVALLVEIEEYFGIQLPDELLTAQTFATPSALWDAIASVQTAEA